MLGRRCGATLEEYSLQTTCPSPYIRKGRPPQYTTPQHNTLHILLLTPHSLAQGAPSLPPLLLSLSLGYKDSLAPWWEFGENKMEFFFLIFTMFFELALFLYSYNRYLELEYSHIDMFMTCVLVYSSCVVIISYMAMYSLLSLCVICRLVHSLHVMYMLS
jgi:hypothetical protein